MPWLANTRTTDIGRKAHPEEDDEGDEEGLPHLEIGVKDVEVRTEPAGIRLGVRTAEGDGGRR